MINTAKLSCTCRMPVWPAHYYCIQHFAVELNCSEKLSVHPIVHIPIPLMLDVLLHNFQNLTTSDNFQRLLYSYSPKMTHTKSYALLTTPRTENSTPSKI